MVAQLGFLQVKPRHWIQGSEPKLTTYCNQELIISFLLFKKSFPHFLDSFKRGKKKKKKIKKPGATENMGGKRCADNWSLCNNGNMFLLPELEILIVDAAQQFISKRLVCVWNRLPNQPCSRLKLCTVFMAFWQYFVLKLGMYLLGHTDVLSVDMCFMSKRNWKG